MKDKLFSFAQTSMLGVVCGLTVSLAVTTIFHPNKDFNKNITDNTSNNVIGIIFGIGGAFLGRSLAESNTPYNLKTSKDVLEDEQDSEAPTD